MRLRACADEEKKLIEQIFTNAIDSLSDDDKRLPQVRSLLSVLPVRLTFSLAPRPFAPPLLSLPCAGPKNLAATETLLPSLFRSRTFCRCSNEASVSAHAVPCSVALCCLVCASYRALRAAVFALAADACLPGRILCLPFRCRCLNSCLARCSYATNIRHPPRRSAADPEGSDRDPVPGGPAQGVFPPILFLSKCVWSAPVEPRLPRASRLPASLSDSSVALLNVKPTGCSRELLDTAAAHTIPLCYLCCSGSLLDRDLFHGPQHARQDRCLHVDAQV